MSATRSPSPAAIGSPGLDLRLSPRSRMEARLAALDTSSEDDEPTPVPRRHRKPSPLPTSTIQPTTNLSEDESDIEIRPRGRLAAQMQADQQVDDHDDQDVTPAPRRLRRRQARDSTTPPPRSPAVMSSPGLFVTEHPPVSPSPAPNAGNASGSDADNLPSIKNARFKALVERKRQERLAREAEEKRKRDERIARQAELDVDVMDDTDDSSGITDDEGGRKLTQGARPTRKAGKKAIEEMNRETQRMARNMQLAHEAKTIKKITKASLFERFNFKVAAPAPAPAAEAQPKIASSSRPTTPGSVQHSDAEMKDAGTPPSSPPRMDRLTTPKTAAEATSAVEADDLPSLADFLVTAKTLDKGKGKAPALDTPEPEAKDIKPKRHVRIKLPPVAANMVSLDSDDELEVTITQKNKMDAVFASVPEKKAQEGNSLHRLRILAQVRAPGNESRKKDKKSSMTPGELQFTLHQRARQQAKLERERRLEMLKAKGIVIQTEEEREKEMQDVEDIVAKARLEVEEIMLREREAAKEEKREKIKNGELDPLAWDESEDEEYQGSDEDQDDVDEKEVELSGSEDEGAEMGTENLLVDELASEGESEASEDGEKPSAESDEEELSLPSRNIRRPKKHAQIISDDEDEAERDVEATPRPKTTTHISPAPPKTISPAIPTSVLRSAKKSFIPGLPVTGPAGLGLTQIFAGTMDDSQSQMLEAPSQASPMPSFGGFPNFDHASQNDTQPDDEMVLNSQSGDVEQATTQADLETQGVRLQFTQSQMHGFDSLLREDENFPSTQMSIEPSQDGGLQDYTPLRERFIDAPSTVRTATRTQEPEEVEPQDSPLIRRGRLRRKMAASVEPEVNLASTAAASNDLKPGDLAFSIMKTAAKTEKKVKEYNKKKSKAKDMFEEQAEESEDEYAGLGGADGEDSDDDDAASVKEMIDDEVGKDDDEHKIAAFYADRERARDEQAVDKLFHDITTGMLRRKRGADYDLSDSDDGGEARRRLKRRQFAKMQKALFADERVKKIAEKPGNQAFLRTLEDRDSDEEMDFLDAPPESMDTDSSQTASQDQAVVPNSQPQADNSRPPLAAAGNGTSANPRRVRDGKKPSNISDIRESLSNLLEEPNASVIPATDAGSDSEADDNNDGDEASRPGTGRSDKENTSPPKQNPRRTAGRPAVIDRMSLKRDNSSNASASARLAFAMPASGGSGFKVPALLRRATTNSLTSASSGSGSGVTSHAGMSASSTSGRGGFGDEGKIKKTAGKKSGISALARETERRAVMEQGAKRREEKKFKGAERRGKVLGELFSAGQFE